MDVQTNYMFVFSINSNEHVVSDRRVLRLSDIDRTVMMPSGGFVVLAVVQYRRLFKCNKGIWWMPWRIEAMKDVARCDKPRLVVSKHLTRGFPNGATHRFGGIVI